MDVVEEAKQFAAEMADRYHIPAFTLTEFAVQKGRELAIKLHADEKLVALGCYLIDIELGRAIEEGRQGEHVKMGIETAKSFLGKFNLQDDYKEKVINCIAAHHGEVKHTCIESEIVRNADCFKFLDPYAVLIPFYYHQPSRSLRETVAVQKAKADEKRGLITLDICKTEAEQDYEIVKRFLDKIT